MSIGRRALFAFAGVTAAVLVGGSFAWACTPTDSLEGNVTGYPTPVAAAPPAAVPVATAAPAQSQTADVRPAPAPSAAPVAPAPAAVRPAATPARAAAQPAAAAPAPVVAPAPAAAPVPAPAPAPVAAPVPAAAPAPAVRTWAQSEAPRPTADIRTLPAGSPGTGQLGIGLALVGVGIAVLAAGAVIANTTAGSVAVRRRAVKALATTK